MIAELLRGVFSATTFDPIHARDPALVKMFGLGRGTHSGVQVDEQKALGYPPFWRGVNLICNGVSKPKLYVYERVGDDDRTKAKMHAAYPILARKANKRMTAVTFRRLLQLWALTWGNGCAWIRRNNAGEPLDLWPLLPDRTTAHAVGPDGQPVVGSSDEDTRVVYVTTIGGEKFTAQAEDVLHIKGLSYNGYVGVPVVEIMRESLGLGMAAEEYGARFFGGGANSSGVLMAPPGMKPEQMDEYRRAVQEGVQGLGKSHKIMVLGNGADYKQLSIPPEHAQFLQTREFQTKDVANILGVQSHKLGDSTRTSYASLEQSNQEHLDDDLDPWFVNWEAECSDKLLTEEQKETETHYVEFNRSSLIRLDATAKASSYAAGRQWGYFCANDIRRMENLPPIEGGDVYLSPANMLPSDSLGMMTAPPVTEEPPAQQNNALADELIGHEIGRLERQVGKAAIASAKKGPREYAEFLDKIPGWASEPACIADVLAKRAGELSAIFGRLAEPPYTAANYTAAVEIEATKLLG